MCKHISFFTYRGVCDTVKICQACGIYWTSDGLEIPATSWSRKYITNIEPVKPKLKNRRQDRLFKLITARPSLFGLIPIPAEIEQAKNWIKTFKGLKAMKGDAQPKKSKLVLSGMLEYSVIKKLALLVGFDLEQHKNIVYTNLADDIPF